MRNKYLFKFIILALFFTVINGCASINSVSLSPIPAQRDQVVRAEASRFIILGFNFNNDYVDQIHQGLMSQCSGGVISGILTKDEVISYFFAHRRRVVVTGFCSKGKQTKANLNLNGRADKLVSHIDSDQVLGL